MTWPVKVAPWLFTKVKVFNGVMAPIEPNTLTVPALVALSVSDWPSAAVPSIHPPTCNAPPAVVSQTWSVRVMPVLASPKVIMPAPLVLMCPAAWMPLGAVAVKPPAKLNVSEAESPKVRLPVWLNTVWLVTVVNAPKSLRL